MLKCFLAGSHGFIGKNIIKKFRQLEIEVLPIPREIYYRPQELRLFFEVMKPDYIINTASYGNIVDQKDMLEIIMANTYIPTNILWASATIQYKAFLNFSSSSVTLPYETFYSASKSASEKILTAFFNEYKSPIASIRPYTVIGVGDNKKHLLPTLIRAAFTGETIDFVSNPVHDYIGVNDLVDALALVIENIDSFSGKVISIGSGIETSNKKLKEIVEKVTGKKINTKEKESLRPYDQASWKSDPSALFNYGWKIREDIEYIVKEIAKNYEQNS